MADTLAGRTKGKIILSVQAAGDQA